MCCIKCDPPLSTTWYDEEWSQRYNWKSWSNSDSLWNEEKIHRKGATTLIWSCILLCLYDANQSVYGNFIASLQFPKRRRLALHPVILKGDRFWLGDLLESCAFCPCYLSLSLYQHAWQRDHVVKVTSIHKCFLLFQLGRLLPCNFLKVSRHKHHIIKWQLWICLQMEPKSCCDNSALPLPGGVMLKGKSRLSAQQKLSKLNPAQKLGFWNHIQSHKILVPQKKRQPRWSFRLCLSWEQGKQCDFKPKKNGGKVKCQKISQSEESLQLHERSEDCNSCQSQVKCQVTNYESSLGRWWCNA